MKRPYQLNHKFGKFVCFFAGALLLALAATSCSKPAETSFRPEMRDAYAVLSRFYHYVWAPEEFADPDNHETIAGLLDQLIEDFHRVEMLEPNEAYEPGFWITLASNQDMLLDVRERFEAGETEYANWKMRGLTANCVSCHSRYDVDHDFWGHTPKPPTNSFEGQLALAEFLVATRQFDKASNYLFRLATTMGRNVYTTSNAFRALKNWLVIEVRVKHRPGKAAEKLQTLISSGAVGPMYESVVRQWITDLEILANAPSANGNSLGVARELLAPVIDTAFLEDDERNLPKTLQASAMLHKLLELRIDPDERRQATFLLAMSYQHIPILSLEVFRELYLERCIREFPNSDEAQRAYLMYHDYMEFLNSGSSGLHLEPDQVKKLKELRSLAFGSKHMIIRDDFPVDERAI